MATKDYITRDPDRWAALCGAVEAGLSLNEIQRQHGIDYRTVRRWFPDYRPFQPGGGGDAAIVRETNRQLRDLEKFGRIGKNREGGFVPREG